MKLQRVFVPIVLYNLVWEKITSADFLFRDVDKLITNFQKEPTLVCICHLGYSLTNNSTHTGILPYWTFKERGLSNFAFQNC